MLRIVHVLAPGQFGGLEQVVSALAQGHRARGHVVTVAPLLVAGADEPSMLEELRAAGVQVHPIVAPTRAYGARLRALREAWEELRPHVVHSHGYLANFLVALSRRRRQPPIVTTVHGFTGGSLKSRFYEWLDRRVYRSFDAVAVVSPPIRDQLIRDGLGASRIHLIQNAWNQSAPSHDAAVARERLGVPDGLLSIGWVGRISHEKGLDVMVKALPHLADLPLRLTVVGDGAERSSVEALARSLGVADSVAWAGVTPNAGRLVRAFDVMVLSSRTEGTPITLLEAMSAKVPVVATAVGGVPDVVSPSEAGLVPSENPLMLAQAIRESLIDRAAAHQRAERAHERLQAQFAFDPWLDAYERVYRAIQPEARS